MIFKIHSRGQGVGAGPVNYLLGKDRNRELASVLRGDPEQTIELIDSLDFARKYTSGVLSFEERDIPDEQKQQIMDSLEHNLLSGLGSDQYEILWVQHQDKDRLELNFVIPNVELKTGKRLQPYYDKADRKRVQAWQEITNYDNNLSDPNDPEKRRTFNYGRNLSTDKKEAIEHITNGLMGLINSGEISDRDGIVKNLQSHGFNVSRKTKKSISIKLPDESRAIRLTGAIYEQDFRAGKGVRKAIEDNIERYRKEREQRVHQARELYTKAHTKKSEYHRERFKPKRIELSRIVEREYKELRENIKKSAKKNNADIQHGVNSRVNYTSFSDRIITPIQHPELVDWVEKMSEISKQLVSTIKKLELRLENQQIEYQEQLSDLEKQLNDMQKQLQLLANFVETTLTRTETEVMKKIQG
ncbi:relaxase/mobilization nuclease domain-containing protein [Pseudoalteromonas sp. Hal099]